MAGPRRRGRAALLLLVLVTCSSCRTSGLAFRNDVPVAVVVPVNRAVVRAPFEVRLATTASIVRRQSTHPTAALFAVFVDQEPMPVGRGLDWVARDDDGCRTTPGCPDRTYLNSHGVFVTTTTSVRIDNVLTSAAGRTLTRGMHSLTVVLLDERGRRAGEPVATRTVIVAEPAHA